jgi:hypothetical protein
MSDLDLEIHVIPKRFYYHEVAYVRGLEAEIKQLRAALEEIDNFAWSALTADCEEARVELNRRVKVCRDVLKRNLK